MFLLSNGICAHCTASEVIGGSSSASMNKGNENEEQLYLFHHSIHFPQDDGRMYLHMCENCHRCDVDIYGNHLAKILIRVRPSIGLSFNRALSFIKDDGRTQQVVLCEECYNTLLEVEGRSRFRYQWVDCWPAFLWKMFADIENVTQCMEMWRYIPYSMRLYWLQSYRGISSSHCDVSLYEPKAYFDDITNFVEEIERLSGSGRLVDLIESCNRNCYCGVRCPWGCTEFADECGYVAYDKFLFAFLKGVKKPVSQNSILGDCRGLRGNGKCFIGIRLDYLTMESTFFDNENWPVRPSLRVVPGKGPLICTCSQHSGGSSRQYLHPPINPVNKTMPCTNGDQLAHAVVAPRMIKTIRCNRFSDTYQMQRCYGGFGGVDSCDILDTGKFDRCTELSGRNTSLSLYGRADIRSKLSQMVECKIVPSSYQESCLEHMDHMELASDHKLLNDALKGATFVSLTDAMKMKTSEEICSNLPFTPVWPLSLAFCQPSLSNYGCKPYMVPSFHSPNDFRLIWFMSSMITSIGVLWECLVKSVVYDGEGGWHGWLLSYSTKFVLKRYGVPRISKKQNPYRSKLSPMQLCQKLEAVENNVEGSGVGEGHQYVPVFRLHQLRCCLEDINNVEAFETMQQLEDSLIEGSVSSGTEVFAIVGDTVDERIPPSFIVRCL